MTDTPVMHFRRERVRIETQRHEIEATLQLPNEGFRSRTTDFLNAHEREFLALAVRHIVLVVELETLGVYDGTGAEPADVLPLMPSQPPPVSVD